MSPFTVKPETPQLINWIQSGSTRSNCYNLRDGVFTVSFSDNVTLHGSYGGSAGKPAGSTTYILDWDLSLSSNIPKVIICISF